MTKSLTRFAAAIGIGAGVTFGLLFVMQYMITSGQNALSDESAFRIVDPKAAGDFGNCPGCGKAARRCHQ